MNKTLQIATRDNPVANLLPCMPLDAFISPDADLFAASFIALFIASAKDGVLFGCENAKPALPITSSGDREVGIDRTRAGEQALGRRQTESFVFGEKTTILVRDITRPSSEYDSLRC